VSARLKERADEVAKLITAENGKPLKWARAEVARGISTFRWAAEETRRWSGQLQRLDTDEVFGPVLVLSRVESDEAGLAAINDSAFGLQAGVFTRRLDLAFKAHKELEVGGVIVGDVPSFRADQMPYGGVKGSGVGREGLASAMEDYTEPRVMVLTGLEL